MSRKIWIQGLAIQADEISIRWLLIQRFRFWTALYPDDCYASGWYVHGPTDKTGPLDEERKIFFENVGLQVIEIAQQENAYDRLYGRTVTGGRIR
jgi:hypothetical protein